MKLVFLIYYCRLLWQVRTNFSGVCDEVVGRPPQHQGLWAHLAGPWGECYGGQHWSAPRQGREWPPARQVFAAVQRVHRVRRGAGASKIPSPHGIPVQLLRFIYNYWDLFTIIEISHLCFRSNGKNYCGSMFMLLFFCYSYNQIRYYFPLMTYQKRGLFFFYIMYFLLYNPNLKSVFCGRT